MLYKVIDRATKFAVLSDIATKREANKLMHELYQQDKKDRCFTKNCYAVREQKQKTTISL